ncbi:MAG TPA: O-antigen ligase family protein [Anaerolineae bacterium]|jgi:hypothetical protein|nr:O-antigen ligase family protein [Ardenticatenia bacterium]HQZ69994.1 O-antigen ligase family protein [Anaerolineae bacterium]
MDINAGGFPARRMPTSALRRAALPAWIQTRQARERFGVFAVLALALFAGSHASLRLAGGVLGLVALWLLLRHPRLALPGMVLMMGIVPLEFKTGTGSGINSVIAGLGILGVLFLLRMLLDGRIALQPTEANGPWMALIASGVLSLVASAALWNPWVVVKQNFVWVQLGQLSVFGLSAVAFWLLANSRYGRDELNWILRVFMVLIALKVTAWFVPGMSIISRLVNWDGPVWRIWAVALAIGFALYHEGLSNERRLCLAAVVPIVLAGPLLISQEVAWEYQAWASGWLPATIALVTILAFWLNSRLRWGVIGPYVFGAGAALLVLYKVLGITGEERFSMDTRAIAWRGLVQLLKGNWLLGLGPASYWHYWKGVFGAISYMDPRTGYLHYTYDPTVNMHNNYLDILGQMGVVGVVIVLWLFAMLFRQALRVFGAEQPGFVKAYAVACAGGLMGMAAAGMLGDWFLPFVYNIGFRGFKDSYLGWLLLGGLTLLEHSSPRPAVQAPAPLSAMARGTSTK